MFFHFSFLSESNSTCKSVKVITNSSLCSIFLSISLLGIWYLLLVSFFRKLSVSLLVLVLSSLLFLLILSYCIIFEQWWQTYRSVIFSLIQPLFLCTFSSHFFRDLVCFPCYHQYILFYNIPKFSISLYCILSFSSNSS